MSVKHVILADGRVLIHITTRTGRELTIAVSPTGRSVRVYTRKPGHGWFERRWR